MTSNTLCGWRFEPVMHVLPKKYFSWFSRNSEAKASELLENPEEMFHLE